MYTDNSNGRESQEKTLINFNFKKNSVYEKVLKRKLKNKTNNHLGLEERNLFLRWKKIKEKNYCETSGRIITCVDKLSAGEKLGCGISSGTTDCKSFMI